MDYFEFTPLNDQELEAEREALQRGYLPEEGTYEYSVIKSEDMISKSGKPMFHFVLDVYVKSSKNAVHLFMLKDKGFLWKIKAFCDSLGMQDKYNEGKLSSSDFYNQSGKAEFTHQYSKERGWKFDVNKFVTKNKNQIEEEKPFKDDDIPF